MARVHFTAHLQRHVAAPTVEAGGGSVREVLDAVFGQNPVLRGYVVDEHGALRKHMLVFVNGEMIADRTSLSDLVDAGAEIYVMQALSGGSSKIREEFCPIDPPL
ncbi:MAG: MoaD/ThiS family protein [Gemmataceae bacterium]|nr:MoaD/ThiS family protein [Gemmataceae bacterium]MCI0743642.1 MoaD/ThiS family protein [Gemmataceae bacterium]